MGIGPLVNLAGGFLQSLITGPAKGSSSAKTTAAVTPSGSVGTKGADQLSPFAQILSSLQQLEQSNPIQYQKVTQQIASSLQTGAQSATATGNPVLASQLTQLSTDFTNASTSGQLPSVNDLAQAIGGGHHRHHHGGGQPSTSGSASSANDNASNLSEFLQTLNAPQPGTNMNNALDALSIIDNTLSAAGIKAA